MTGQLSPERLAYLRRWRERGLTEYEADQLIGHIDWLTAEQRTGPEMEIAAQRARNHARWGDRSIEVRPPDYRGWLPTLGEEYGEVCRALTLEEGDPARLRAELIDVGAMALMWIDSIDRAALDGSEPPAPARPGPPGPVPAENPREVETVDLVVALRASVEAAKARRLAASAALDGPGGAA